MPHFTVTPKYKRGYLLLLAVLLGLTVGVGCGKRSPPPRTPPDWVEAPPHNHYVGSAYYGVETEDGARRNAVADAINSLLVLKGGVATVSSEVRQDVESRILDSGETVSATATVSTSATIAGQDIPVNVRIIEFWKNHQRGMVHVLVQDLNPQKNK